jgi:4'-phosphopantetheinyl transferase
MYAENRAPLSAEIMAFLFSIISEEEKQKIEKLYRLKDKQASLLGKLLLYKLFGGNLASRDKLFGLTYSANGKPLMEGKDVSFNISHSGDYVVCAMTGQEQIGVDIEKIEEINLDGFSCILSLNEFNYIKKSQRKNYEFFKIWTSKEAILKAKGLGIQRDMTGFEILHNGVWIFRHELFFLTEIEIDPEYCCMVATTKLPVTIQKTELIPEVDNGSFTGLSHKRISDICLDDTPLQILKNDNAG